MSHGTTNTEKEPPSFKASSEIVTIIVGPKKKITKFTVHRSFLCYRSPFFEAAFNGKFKEGETQSMRLEDVSEDAFDILVQWVYEQKVKGATDHSRFIALVELWHLAERFLMPKLQNDAMDAIWSYMADEDELEDDPDYDSREWDPSEEFINLVYATGLDSTPLKRLLIKKLAWKTKPVLLKAACNMTSWDVAMDVMMELANNHYELTGRRDMGVVKDYYVKTETQGQ